MVIALSHKSYLFASIRAAVLAVVAKRADVLPTL